jgi:hypothetical protein
MRKTLEVSGHVEDRRYWDSPEGFVVDLGGGDELDWQDILAQFADQDVEIIVRNKE